MVHVRAAIRLFIVFGLIATSPGTQAGSANQGTQMAQPQTSPLHSNHLINENSPYLLSHAHNPVDWYPWGDEALEKAKREDKPIFLSIGYAACHWCHVMERESFENQEIAAILNEHYVSIKVDREQRPDLDQIYMTCTQALTGGGGWPMSVFLSPELKPFFAGTYFPPEDYYGRPGFKRVISEIAKAWREERRQVLESADAITQSLKAHFEQPKGQALLVSSMIAQGAVELMGGFDHTHGGFGRAPKFPHATELMLFLRYYHNTGDMTYRQAAEKTLRAMGRGGIYDQLGGGFARYSTDAKWLVPHFEKMLYDNALLAPVYAEAYRITRDSFYLDIVSGTLDFILREMTDSSGGFYSALDADSEGEEGKFYVWSKQEIYRALGDESEDFCRYYNVTEGGNFEGRNILHITESSDRLKQDHDAVAFEKRLADAREKLVLVRAKRVRPLTDDKILTSWNGLAVSALAAGYRVTSEQKYLDAAVKNAEFVRSTLWRGAKLTHSYRRGRHSDGQFLEDYSYYLRGLLDLYQADHSDGNLRWLDFAAELADNAIRLFLHDDGSLYMREANQADLLYRPREDSDGALPSPASLLIESLLKLGRLTGNNAYTSAGQTALRALSGLMARHPGGMASALLALDYHLGDKIEVVIVGDGPERARMLGELRFRLPANALLAVSSNGGGGRPLFEGRSARDGEAVAYVCRNSVCRLPVTTAAELGAALEAVDLR
ncbi:MAG: thioredoxin domain-containing protein [Candidatus Zixiibacteriota bacterium]